MTACCLATGRLRMLSRHNECVQERCPVHWVLGVWGGVACLPVSVCLPACLYACLTAFCSLGGAVEVSVRQLCDRFECS